jgi:hypothetical protein
MSAQTNLKVFAEKEGDKTVIYIDNDECCPLSVQLLLTMQNMTADEPADHIYLVPKYTDKFKLVELDRIKRGRTSYSYNYTAVYGDVMQNSYDQNWLYDLPYSKGSTYRIDQGYNGTFTHQNENALDFNMPELKSERQEAVL